MVKTTTLVKRVVVTGLLAMPGVVLAQTSPDPVAPATQRPASATGIGATEVGEIVVTAERRAEDIQRVPIAITALEGATLDSQGIVGFQDLGLRVPSLRFGAGVTGGEDVITMRGLGSQNTTPGGDSPVAYNLDGVYLQRTTAIDPEFYDIARIEVLRGPQGTLYGRNSVGGSINVITNAPSDAFAASADALFGNYDQRTFRGFVSGPLIASGDLKVDARLTAVRATHDPYALNLSTAPGATHNQDAQDYWMVRGQLKIELGSRLDVNLLATTSESKDPAATTTAWWEAPNRFIVNNGQAPIPLGSACDFSTAALFQPRIFCHDYPENADNRVGVFAGTLNWRLPFATLTSVTAYADSTVNQASDGDGSALPIAAGSIWELKQHQFSQEVRLAPRDEPSAVRWLAGFIYFYAFNYENFAYSDFGYNDVAPFPKAVDEFNFLSHGTNTTKSWAPFGQVDVDLSRTRIGIPLTVTAGLRYTHDDRYGYNYLDYQLPIACGGSCGVSQGPFSASWGQLTGKFGLQYQVTSDLMAYASVARGYLAGGNIVGLAHVYGPETLWSYEAGFKSRFWEDRAQFDLAAYREAISALQVFVQSSTESGINNVNGTTFVNGLEAEFTIVPVQNLRLNAAVTLTDAKYGSYITTDSRFGGPGPGCETTSAPYLCNFQGHDLNQTPPYTVDLGAEYTFHTALGTITPRIDSFFSGKVQFLPDNYPTSTQKPYHLTNVHLTWLSANGRFKVEGFVDNIENANVISDDGLQSVTLGQQVIEPDNFTYYPPRTYGIRIGVNFGG